MAPNEEGYVYPTDEEFLKHQKKEWQKRASYHPPRNDEERKAHEEINQKTRELGEFLIDTCPMSIELDSALEQIMLARMFANAARAIHVNTGDDEEVE